MSDSEMWEDLVMAATARSGCLVRACQIDLRLHPLPEDMPIWYAELEHSDEDKEKRPSFPMAPKVISIQTLQRRNRRDVVTEIARWLELHHPAA